MYKHEGSSANPPSASLHLGRIIHSDGAFWISPTQIDRFWREADLGQNCDVG
jgi:hypothetical protein